MPLQFVLPDSFSTEQLLRVVRGQDKTIPRVRAIALLQESNLPRKAEIFSDLITNEAESSRIRHQAVVGLYASKVAQTPQLLLNNLQVVRDDRTQATLVQFLGRIGRPDALPEVIQLRDRSTGFVREQAQFAASLIAYRHRLPEHDLAFPKPEELIAAPENSETRPTVVTDAPVEEAELALKSLMEEPFGIALSRESLQQIWCEPRNYLLALNEEFSGADAVRRLQSSKALVGLLTLKSPEGDRYSTACTVLTTPQDQGQIQVLLKATNGQTLFAGVADTAGDTLKLRVQAVRRPGAVPVTFSATFANGRLTNVEAASALRTVTRRAPQRG